MVGKQNEATENVIYTNIHTLLLHTIIIPTKECNRKGVCNDDWMSLIQIAITLIMRSNSKKNRRPWESFHDCTVLRYKYDRGPDHPTSLPDKLVTVECQKSCWREDNIHCSPLIYWASHLIVEVCQVGEAWFPLHKYMLSIPNHLLVVFMVGKSLQN